MTYHKPVLLREAVQQLQPRSGGLYVDCTIGGGGHAEGVLRVSAPDGRLIGLDCDEEAVAASRERLREFGTRVQVVRANFVELESVLMNLGVTTVDAVLFDLGVSSRQFDEPSRGFSFQREGPLDMRMDRQLGASARDVLRSASLEELAQIFFTYGEERRARAIARRIVDERQRNPIETTTQLALLIQRVLGPKRGRIHPATRVFQALRIVVNNELENLKRGLAAAVRALKPGGRIAVISFHSLEDRIVKRFFMEQSRGESPTLQLVTRKPITPSQEETSANPRARSAKLRVAEKLFVGSGEVWGAARRPAPQKI
jgi:16S rRNA (cytosine1402-N4)-methyltransferase